jgi:DNA-binding beta-propeller fold protein YncE
MSIEMVIVVLYVALVTGNGVVVITAAKRVVVVGRGGELVVVSDFMVVVVGGSGGKFVVVVVGGSSGEFVVVVEGSRVELEERGRKEVITTPGDDVVVSSAVEAVVVRDADIIMVVNCSCCERQTIPRSDCKLLAQGSHMRESMFKNEVALHEVQVGKLSGQG